MRWFLRVCVAIVVLSQSTCFVWASYRPLAIPKQWTFTVPTPAYRPGSGEHLGDFQAGITVDVVEVLPGGGKWRVVYRRFGAADIEALVSAPSLIVGKASLEHEAAKIRDEFPLLGRQLEAETPWPEKLPEMVARHFEKAKLEAGNAEKPVRVVSVHPEVEGRAWGLSPLAVAADYSMEGRPRLIFEFWNKGDGHRARLRPDQGYRQLKEQLDKLERLFDTRRGVSRQVADGAGITAVKDQAELYYLPNDTVVTLRYRSGEYLILELSSYENQGKVAPPTYDPATFAETMRSRVKTSNKGHRYVSEIPMISQGDKGYCAAATLARVLNYYGYPVDMHAMADLAKTEGTRGTSRDNIIAAMRRVCGSTPFRMRELNTRKRVDILSVIERGLPIIWVVPGHMRLLIGVHPDGEVVYSDSWGPGHDYKVMSWNDYVNENQGMWVLEPMPL